MLGWASLLVGQHQLKQHVHESFKGIYMFEELFRRVCEKVILTILLEIICFTPSYISFVGQLASIRLLYLSKCLADCINVCTNSVCNFLAIVIKMA